MNFQTAIQILCQLTQIKVADLAQAINYDRSIVSKWKNGQRLLSRKNYKRIIRQLSYCFTKVIVAEQIEDQLKGLCQVQVTLRNKVEVQETIADILELAYYQSETEFETKGTYDEDFQSFVAAAITEVVTDIRKMTEFCKEQFLDRIAKSDEDVDIYSTVNLSMLVEVLLSTLKHVAFKKNRKVVLHVAVKQNDLLELTNHSFYLFTKLMLTSSYIDIQLYMYQDQPLDEFLYISGDCIGWVMTTKSGMPSLIYSQSQQLGQYLFDQNASVFNSATNLVEVFDHKQEGDNIYPMTLPSKKFLLSGFISDYFFPKAVLDYIKGNLETPVTVQSAKQLDEFYEEWEQKVFANDFHLVITKVAFIHFIRTGHIQVDGQLFKIPHTYKIYLLRRFWNDILSKERMHVYIIDNEEQGDSTSQMNVSILFTESSVSYFKDIENTGHQMYRQYSIRQPVIVKDLYGKMDSFVQTFEQNKLVVKDFKKVNGFIDGLEMSPNKHLSSNQIASYLEF